MSALPPRPASRRPASLRRDLALRLSLGLVLAWLAAVGGAGLALKARTDRIFDSALQETAERILPLAPSSRSRPTAIAATTTARTGARGAATGGTTTRRMTRTTRTTTTAPAWCRAPRRRRRMTNT